MLEGIRVKHFRGLNNLYIERLSHINLFAGRNNSGKTSLLEALFLMSGWGNPRLLMSLNAFRGIEGVTGTPEAVGDTLWKHFFFALDMERDIEISATHASLGELTLEIAPVRADTIEIPVDDPNLASLGAVPEHALQFLFSNGPDKEFKTQIRLTGQSVQLSQSEANIPYVVTLLSSGSENIEEDAARLGQLRRRKKGDLVLDALRVVEPRLQGVEDNMASGKPMIWGDVGLAELVPLPVMGEGMTRLARLVLAISSSPEGQILVDEVENGFHHSVLPDVWRVVDEAATQFNTQIFATTHSLECVAAAYESLDADRFRLHRLETDGEVSRCVTYEPDSIEAAIQHGLEVR